jgi:glycosyltransferase involved in cell wall biosynthesis
MRREKPDAVLAVKHRAIVTAVLAGIISGFKGRIVGNIHTTISAGLAYYNFIKRFTYLGEMRLFYRLAHAIVGVSRGVADDIKNITRLDGEKVKTIYNPVITPEIFVQGKQPLDHPWFSNEPIPVILGIGRLTKQKDFHTLINAFTEVHKTRACRLVILGDGADLDSLRSLTREKGIQDDVDFAGFQANPYAYLSRASLFVLSSRWEGFGMVLVEAMAFGTPVVSTDCPNGPREILKDGQYGHLVPVEDPPALAKAMIKTLDDPLAFEKLESKAQDFTAGRAARQYLQTLII